MQFLSLRYDLPIIQNTDGQPPANPYCERSPEIGYAVNIPDDKPGN